MILQMQETRTRSVIYTLVSALLLALALPNELLPGGNPLLALICLVPYFRALHSCRRIGAAMWLGALFGVVSTTLNHYWLMFFGSFSLWTITSVLPWATACGICCWVGCCGSFCGCGDIGVHSLLVRCGPAMSS